jgi:hypothetical protein
MLFRDILMVAAKGGGGGGVVWTDRIVNGGFATDGAPWGVNTFGSSSIGGGEAILDDPSGNDDAIYQLITGQGAGTYRLTYTVSAVTSGTMRPSINSLYFGTSISTTGAKSNDIVCAGDPSTIEFQAGLGADPVGFHFDDVTLTRIS